ncbi:TadE/TadG family type IV pilus assembly protein [Sphingomonas naphthae]|uniref:TadE/TadG family type IV pilus assembly protein n=1 Tax=Sphingomonas naphthae TaxID=1813468 RepID=A0ABY7TS98_9SPHN|nr:TadE/TadG family type IV pilus assembly protein [Sphingomonas naphthae]WCT75104.1 TadE/TadG family type IV pilus assembly protein [Sphingomonas naphthae]
MITRGLWKTSLERQVNRGSLRRNTTGAAVVEFALVLPLLLTILFAIVVYGTYFWRAHGLQQVANDAARVAIGGVTKAERKSLVDATIASELPSLGGISTTTVTTNVADTGAVLTVTLAYNAQADLATAAGFIPLPSAMIQRVAVVRLAGL